MIADWRAFALGSAFFAALTAILGKIGIAGVGSNAATVFRTLIVFLTGMALLTYFHEWENPFTWSPRTSLFLTLSGMATGLSWLCYYRALQLAPASRVAVIDKLSVVFVILLAALFLGEKITLKLAVGAGLVTAGAILLAF